MSEVKKTYYSISEVCRRTDLEPHVLRYWESEFPQLRPKKNRAGNRAYREKDIEIITYIRHLLYSEQYTIPGAKKKLAGMKTQDPSESSNGHKNGINGTDNGDAIAGVVNELKSVLDFLKS